MGVKDGIDGYFLFSFFFLSLRVLCSFYFCCCFSYFSPFIDSFWLIICYDTQDMGCVQSRVHVEDIPLANMGSVNNNHDSSAGTEQVGKFVCILYGNLCSDMHI